LGTAFANSDSWVLEVSSDLFYALHCEMPLDFGVLMMNLSRELARRFITTSAMLVKLKSAFPQQISAESGATAPGASGRS